MPIIDSLKLSSRLKWLGLIGVILAWSVIAVELSGTATLWIYNKREAVTALLWGFAQDSSYLTYALDEGGGRASQYSPTTPVTLLLVGLDFIPLLFSACILLRIGMFFLNFSIGEVLSERNKKNLWYAGVMYIVSPVVYPVVETLQGLALSIDLPAGQRILKFSFGFSSIVAFEIIEGVLLCLFSSIISDVLRCEDGE
ncbi:hypothetical protein P3C29_29595 [Pseudomonas sp. 1912-s]|uniref:hypothetical protein n=1 Tax=Pseudomonas sp. 1912-s TaxID=3033802 RepID=UPI0023DF3D7F|nr:hypothetical protein [Pseudomonas sp. 1912-s]MDF3202850.1 hypothetical protein [Pseudomonas sp. 1912-s]